MRIKYLRIRNFTSLVDVELSDLPNLVIFIGQNSSGKSNIIDAMALLFTEFGNEVSIPLGPLDDYHHLLLNHNTQTNQFPNIEATRCPTPEEWASLLSVDYNVGKRLEGSHVDVGKRIANISGIAIWETHTVTIDHETIVEDGEFPSDSFSIVPDDGEDATDDLVGIDCDEFLNRLAELLRASFRVIHTSGDPRSWPNRFLERPTIIGADHVEGLWGLSQSKGSQRRPWTSPKRTTPRRSRIVDPDGRSYSIHSHRNDR